MATLDELRRKYGKRAERTASLPARSGERVGVFWTQEDLDNWLEKFPFIVDDDTGEIFEWDGKPHKIIGRKTIHVKDAQLGFGKFKGTSRAGLSTSGQGRGYLRFLFGQFTAESAEPVRRLISFVLDEDATTIVAKHNAG